eukprot:236483_1
MAHLMVKLKVFYQFSILTFSIWTLATFRTAFMTNTLLQDHKVIALSHETDELNIWNIEECWSHLLITLFIQPELDHLFTNIHWKQTDTNLIPRCNITKNNMNDIDLLLDDTLNTLKSLTTNTGFTFHSLIALRRSIMLVSQVLNVTNNNFYLRILQQTFNTEQSFRRTVRYQYPIFNIHLPRSAGTSICSFFKSSRKMQEKSNHSRSIRFNREPGRNCNIGDGLTFYRYLTRSHSSKTCKQQYHMAKGYNIFAGESPLYPPKNSNVSHPELCDGFVYILPVRSPIERILSWLKMDASFFVYSKKHSKGERLDLSAFMTGFFSSLFDYDVNPSNREKIVVRRNGTKKRITTGNRWVRGYASNALTRWIGYEFSSREITNNELMKGMLAHKDVINSDDIHFYNAIQLMLRVDYVLNFASYGESEDDSTVSAIKNGTDSREFKGFERILLADVTRIMDGNNAKSVWNMLQRHLNEHYETNVFDWNRRRSPRKNNVFDLLTGDDWNALYKENYFDFRLYALAKQIGNIDVEYDQMRVE